MAEQREPDIPLLATRDLVQGRTYIVTGANTGLGYETAKHLTSLGAARVIMTARNLDAGEKAKARIFSELSITESNGSTNLEVWDLDLSQYESVRTFAKRAITGLDRIDGVVQNAGVFAANRTDRFEGWNASTTVNVLSTFMLTALLLPKMSQTAKEFDLTGQMSPHLVIVGSNWSFYFKDEWEKIKADPLNGVEDEGICGIHHVYALSKMMDILGTRQLASTIAPYSRTGVVINTVCPGLCKSELQRNAAPGFKEVIDDRVEKIGRTAEMGSRNFLFAVTAGESTHGHFLQHAKDADDFVPDWAAATQKNTWDVVARELEKVQPGWLNEVQRI